MIIKTLETEKHSQFINITKMVQQAVMESDLQSGTVTVFVPHTTAGTTINENSDPDVCRDLLNGLERSFPWEHEDYQHAEGNTAAHMKASMMGNSTQVIVEHGLLQLGTWQGIYFCEFDGPRNRQVWIKIVGV